MSDGEYTVMRHGGVWFIHRVKVTSGGKRMTKRVAAVPGCVTEGEAREKLRVYREGLKEQL